MKPILLCWVYDADLVIVPDFVADNLLTYQKKFDKWIKKKSKSFDVEVFIKWLNEYIIENENEKAEIIKGGFFPSEEDMKLPRIYF